MLAIIIANQALHPPPYSQIIVITSYPTNTSHVAGKQLPNSRTFDPKFSFFRQYSCPPPLLLCLEVLPSCQRMWNPIKLESKTPPRALELSNSNNPKDKKRKMLSYYQIGRAKIFD